MMNAVQIPEELIGKYKSKLREINLSSGEAVCYRHCFCANLLVVKKGCLRVFKQASDGRMFTLYRVNAGECCSLMLASILKQAVYPAMIEAEGDVIAYSIPSQEFRQLVREEYAWQTYVFLQLSEKITRLAELADNLVFNNMDSRIADLLCRRLGESCVLNTTHQCIANEVGTSREVVSRSLRFLESEGHIKLTRGQVEVINLDALNSYTALH